jgi:5-methylcytosine-specific restriction endonuclease McrA
VKQVSAKRRARMAVYARSRQEVADRCGGRCEARIEGVCTGWLEHVHHRRLRSQGGSDDPSNLVGICRKCHDHAHRNPKLAGELGLIDFTVAEPLSLAVTKVYPR